MWSLDRLRHVRERLFDGDGDSRDRLQAAGFDFLLAADGRETWPAELRGEAERVRAGLLTIGVADSGVWEADEAEVEAMMDDLRRLCDRVERACGGAVGRPSRACREAVLC